MQNETCKTCKFCYIGECRRWPPTTSRHANDLDGVYYEINWPSVKEYHWCGEYKSKLDEVREENSTQA